MDHGLAYAGLLLELALRGKTVPGLEPAGEDALFHLLYEELFFCRDFNDADLHEVLPGPTKRAGLPLFL